MAKQKIPCPTALRLLLRYEPETGKLFFRKRALAWSTDKAQAMAWNAKYADKETFRSIGTNGYLMGYILGANKTAHRVIMAMHLGMWPTCDVDHIDGDRHNNRLENLRLATRQQNLRNTGSRKGSSSQFCGVGWDASRGKWTTYCTGPDGRMRHLGRFADEADAARAYDKAAREWHGEFARLNFPPEAG